MPSQEMTDRIYRVIDANANRLREGLRVVEEIARMVLDNGGLTSRLRQRRHAVDDLVGHLSIPRERLLSARDSEGDVGSEGVCGETPRTDCEAILRANLRRSQESCRVLEEFSKLFDPHIPASFKKIRFELYTLEKEIVGELKKNRHEEH
ncbi:MAG: thiamine-phosphate pyrophosphorylase [bacterium]